MANIAQGKNVVSQCTFYMSRCRILVSLL